MKPTKLFTAVLIIFIAGIIYYGFLFYTGNLELPTQEPSGITSEKLMIKGDNVIAVTAQKPGKEVFVNFLLLKDSGFVAVYEINSTDASGVVAGTSTLLPAGQSQATVITLSKEMSEGENYVAVIYKDNGDGVFDEEADIVVTDEGGTMIQGTFSVSKDADPVNVQL